MNNYKKYVHIMENIGIENIEQVVKCLRNDCISKEALVIKHGMADVFEDVLKELSTDKKCPHCGKTLYLSDVEGYAYVCTYCDENFYTIEVK